ncbi:MAG: hypothetical protein IT355_20920 [Gemmatimonadaceae bacterium]|nr:hypothetical protein [Gemmatimonadaceae bacterium]
MPEQDPLPDGTNFFAVLVTPLTRPQVAALFADHGWRVRHASRSSYMVRTDWCELVLEGAQPFLLHGPVAALLTNASRIVQLCRDAGIACTAECYGEDGDLLKVLTTHD